MQTIQVKYSCHLCGLSKTTVDVQARQEESVTDWMKEICIWAIARDHSAKSPTCTAKSISEVMIPITGADRVGGPAVQ